MKAGTIYDQLDWWQRQWRGSFDLGLYLEVCRIKKNTMKNLIDYFTPTTEEHKSFLRHFLGTLTAFIVLGGIFYCLMYLKAL